MPTLEDIEVFKNQHGLASYERCQIAERRPRLAKRSLGRMAGWRRKCWNGRIFRLHWLRPASCFCMACQSKWSGSVVPSGGSHGNHRSVACRHRVHRRGGYESQHRGQRGRQDDAQDVTLLVRIPSDIRLPDWGCIIPRSPDLDQSASRRVWAIHTPNVMATEFATCVNAGPHQ